MNDRTLDTSALPEKLRAWLGHAVDSGASDLHLIAGHPPTLRLHGDLVELAEAPLPGEEVQALLGALCSPENFSRFQAQKTLDPSFELHRHDQRTRFRVNLFQAGGHAGACLRLVRNTI